MKALMNKKILLGSVLALFAVTGVAQAASRFTVRDTAGTTDKMVITDSGRIGINTSTPTASIEIKGSVYPDNSIKVVGNEVTQGGGYLTYIERTGSLPILNDRLGFFLFGSPGTTFPLHAAGFEAKAEEAWTETSVPAYFSFLTTQSGSIYRTERLRITGSGNIGIGTSTPAQKLEVKNGGFRLNIASTTAQPACTSSIRGTFWVKQAGTSVADTVEVCLKNSTGNYVWNVISSAP